MTNKVILSGTLVAAFAVSAVMYAAFADGGDHLTIQSTDVNVQDGSTLDVKIKTASKIPKDESGAFGYAVLTDGTNKVLVVVTHVPAFDDSNFDDKKGGFHTHVLNLVSPTAACTGATFEVDLASTITDPGYKNNVDGKHIAIKNVPVADLGDAGVETIASFSASVPGFNLDGSPTNVCVTVVDTVP